MYLHVISLLKIKHISKSVYVFKKNSGMCFYTVFYALKGIHMCNLESMSSTLICNPIQALYKRDPHTIFLLRLDLSNL